MPPHINAPLIHDRGEARVFRGRDAIRAQFGLLLEAVAADPTLGSCMLFQGPPGIGKTALLLELAKQGSKSSWRVFHIEAAALGSPAQMAKALNWSHLHKRRKFTQAALGGYRRNGAAGILRGDLSNGCAQRVCLSEAQANIAGA